MRHPFLLLATFFLLTLSGFSQSPAGSKWLVTFDAGRSGSLQAIVVVEKNRERIIGRSMSGSTSVIGSLQRAAENKAAQGEYLFEFSAVREGEDYKGKLLAPKNEGEITLRIEEGRISGSISGGSLKGKFKGEPASAAKLPLRDYKAVVADLRRLVEKRVYDPRTLRGSDWERLTSVLDRIAAAANDDLDLIIGFNYAYDYRPFSHLTLSRAQAPAKAMIESFDKMRVGGTPASVRFEDGVAILKVETMIGIDTEELIAAAYDEIAKKKPKALIIDLRGNGGGAFAVKPLIEHVIDEPLDAGYFLTNPWYTTHSAPPSRSEILSVTPWEGYSLKAWWASVQTDPLIRLRFEPAEPNFDGPVYVLIDKRSASATELAADAFKASGKAVLIGERTAGQMLTQSPFDLVAGFQAFVPVGDYFSFKNGRIEGVGVSSDVEASSNEAMLVALRLIAERR
jgi:hypothetical protein